jgi:hypothetical protein
MEEEFRMDERMEGNLLAAVRSLKKRKARIIYSLYWIGLTEAEIAFAHNITERTVRNYLSDAAEQIKRFLERDPLFQVPKPPRSRVRKHPNGLPLSILQVAREALSCNPGPDVYYDSPMRRDFLDSVAECCSSAVRQAMREYKVPVGQRRNAPKGQVTGRPVRDALYGKR